jgi:hypothetical protein
MANHFCIGKNRTPQKNLAPRCTARLNKGNLARLKGLATSVYSVRQ